MNETRNEEKTPENPRPPGSRPYGFYKGMKKPPNSGWKPFTRGSLAKLREFMTKIEIETRFMLPNGDLRTVTIRDPAEWLLFVGLQGRDPLEASINMALKDKSPFRREYLESKGSSMLSDGTIHAAGYVPLETRAKCIISAIPFVRPKLSSVELTADVNTTYEQQSQLGSALSKDPEVREMFERISEKAANMAAGDGEDDEFQAAEQEVGD